MRTFIAVEVPVPVKNRIAELENQLKETDIKWVPPPNIHITLIYWAKSEMSSQQLLEKGLARL